MSSYKWLLDAGHGGITADGKYLSASGRTHVFKDGLTINEGVINRAIVDEVIPELEYSRVEYEIVHDEFVDKPPIERIELVNRLYAEDKRCIYVSIHSDRMPNGNRGRRTGYGFYTPADQATEKIRRRNTKDIATTFSWSYELAIKNFRSRKDYVRVETAEDFSVLRELKCPSVLIQNLYFDNRKDAEFLLSEDGRGEISTGILWGIWHSETMNGYEGWMVGGVVGSW